VTGVQTCALPIYNTPGTITRIDTSTNAVIGTIASTLQSKNDYLEYLSPLSGVDRVYMITSSAAAAIIEVRNLASPFPLITNIATAAGDQSVSGVIIRNAASAMDRMLVVAMLGGTVGLRIIDCETNLSTASGIAPSGVSAGNQSFFVDYHPVRDELAVSYPNQNIILILQPLTATTFTTVKVITSVLTPMKVRYDVANDLLLVSSRAGGTGSLDVYFQKFTLPNYTPVTGLQTSNRQNGISGQIKLVGDGSAWMVHLDSTASNISHFSRVKYA
jgi:hypothetical protein